MTRAEPELIVHPSVPWPVLRNRPLIFVGPITGVPSGVIGRRPDQKEALATSPAGEEIGHGMLERLSPGEAEIVGVAGNLRHAADTDAVAETGDGDLVGLVHDSRFRCA
jgi:hypothetical protein